MNSIRKLLAGTVLAAGALTAAGAVVSLASAADTATTPATPPPGGPHGGPHGWHHHGHDGWFLKELNLTDAQKTSIKTIMQTDGAQMKSLMQQLHTNSAKLREMRPDDPNYGNVVSQTASVNASVHQQIDTLKATIRQEIFAKLTPEQQTRLQQLEAQAEARRAAHAAGGEPPAT